jgi:uncharacterized protein
MIYEIGLATLLQAFSLAGSSGSDGYGTLLYGIDKWYLILVIPAFLLSLVAQAAVKGTFNKYSRLEAHAGHTGQTAARRILDHYGLNDIRIEQVAGQLTDHYDPRSRTLRLSQSTFNSTSIAAIGVAAHEAGHAVQHDEGYMPNKLRSLLVPVAQIGSSFGPYLVILGLMLSMTALFNVGIVLYAGAVLFYLVTLPVELNASTRAIRVLDEQNLLTDEELGGARKVLRAAAMTYIASALVAFASLLRFFLLARGRNDSRR